MHKFGHCLSQNFTCEIELLQAKLSLEQQSHGSVLPLLLKDKNSYILTYFGVDNSGKLIESVKRGGSVHSTYPVAFQESSLLSIENKTTSSLRRDRKRKLTLTKTPINSKRNHHVILKLNHLLLTFMISTHSNKKHCSG